LAALKTKRGRATVEIASVPAQPGGMWNFWGGTKRREEKGFVGSIWATVREKKDGGESDMPPISKGKGEPEGGEPVVPVRL